MTAGVHEATVLKVEPLAREVLRYRFALAQPFSFAPGQFVSLRVADDSDGNPVLRSYSIASLPGQPEVALVVKRAPGGLACNWFDALAPGQPVRFTGPMGFFVLDSAHPGDVVFGATGVGIAPVLPMLGALLGRAEPGRVILHWGNRAPDELFWNEELDALGRTHPRFEVRRYVSGAGDPWSGPRGRITQPILDSVATLTRPTFYLVGNGAMIREVKTGLQARGVDRKQQIRNEAFFD